MNPRSLHVPYKSFPDSGDGDILITLSASVALQQMLDRLINRRCVHAAPGDYFGIALEQPPEIPYRLSSIVTWVQCVDTRRSQRARILCLSSTARTNQNYDFPLPVFALRTLSQCMAAPLAICVTPSLRTPTTAAGRFSTTTAISTPARLAHLGNQRPAVTAPAPALAAMRSPSPSPATKPNKLRPESITYLQTTRPGRHSGPFISRRLTLPQIHPFPSAKIKGSVLTSPASIYFPNRFRGHLWQLLKLP